MKSCTKLIVVIATAVFSNMAMALPTVSRDVLHLDANGNVVGEQVLQCSGAKAYHVGNVTTPYFIELNFGCFSYVSFTNPSCQLVQDSSGGQSTYCSGGQENLTPPSTEVSSSVLPAGISLDAWCSSVGNNHVCVDGDANPNGYLSGGITSGTWLPRFN